MWFTRRGRGWLRQLSGLEKVAGAGALLLAILLCGCLQSEGVRCADGRICPGGTICDNDLHRCLGPAQLDACESLNEGDACELEGSTGVCVSDACVLITCGNGVVDPGEACDDGNLLSGDGCRADCRSDETCGNGVIDFENGEQCDCGDGTSELPGSCDAPNDATGAELCRADCRLSCGDGVVAGSEFCDGSSPPGADCVSLGFGQGALDCTSFCTPAISDCQYIGWIPFDTGLSDGLRDVWGTSPDDYYVVGSGGTIAHFDGTGFTEIGPGGDGELEAVQGGGGAVFVAGAGDSAGVLFRDSGGTFVEERTFPSTPFDLWVFDGDNLAVLAGSTVFQKISGSWSSTDISGARAVWGTSPTNLYVVSDSGDIHHYDGSWGVVHSTTADLRAIWGTSDTDIFVAGVNYAAHRDSVGWSELELPTQSVTLYEIVGSAPDRVFFKSFGDEVLHWDGTLLFSTSADSSTNGIHVFPDGSAVGVGSWGAAYNLSNSQWGAFSLGDTWVLDLEIEAGDLVYSDIDGNISRASNGKTTVDHANGSSVWHLVSQGSESLWAAASEQLLQYDGDWDQSIAVPGSGNVRDVWTPDGIELFVADELAGGVHHFDGEWSFTETPSPMLAVWGRSATDVFAVGLDGTIMHYDGAGWTQQSSGTSSGLYAVHGVGTRVFVAGFGGTILTLGDQGWAAMETYTLAHLRGLWARAEDDVYAGADNGTLLHYDGQVWTRVQTPVGIGSIRSFVEKNGVFYVATADPGMLLRFDRGF